MKKRINPYLSDAVLERLEWLAKRYGGYSAAIERAILALYEKEHDNEIQPS